MTSPSFPHMPTDLTVQTSKHRLYRFWPVYAMSFLRTFFFSIYSIALPNYLIFDQNLASSLVGTVGASFSIAYILGPFFGRKVTDILGIKKTLIISHSISVISIFISIFTTNSTVLILMRTLDGFVNGFFWINTLNLIATWEKTTEKNTHRNYLSIFNYSWNFGLIGGYLVGYAFVLFLGNDFIALIVSAIFASLLIPCAFLLEPSEEFEFLENQAVVLQDLKLRTKPPSHSPSYSPQNKLTDESKSKNGESLSYVPILMAWGGILLFASSKSIFKFTLPYFFKLEGMSSYWVYLVVLFQQAFQMAGLTLIRKIENKRYGYFAGMGVVLLLTSSFFFSPSILVISILNIFAGFFIGLIQGVTQRIVLDHGKDTSSNKYTMINEIIMGISFGVVPFIAGFLNEYNILYVFVFLVVEISLLAIILIFTHWKFSQTQKKG